MTIIIVCITLIELMGFTCHMKVDGQLFFILKFIYGFFQTLKNKMPTSIVKTKIGNKK